MKYTTKEKLIKEVVHKTGYEYSDVKLVINTFLSVMLSYLNRKIGIKLEAFGTFRFNLHKARYQKNPDSDETIMLPDRYIVKFYPSSTRYKR